MKTNSSHPKAADTSSVHPISVEGTAGPQSPVRIRTIAPAPSDILDLAEVPPSTGSFPASEEDASPGQRRGPADHTKLLQVTRAHCHPFTSPDGRELADVFQRNRRETLLIRGPEFKNWLIGLYYHEFGEAPPPQARERVIETYEAAAHRCDTVRTVHLRVASRADTLYLDLCDDSWTAVEVDADGWRLVKEPPVRFRRSPSMEALPRPERGGSIEGLRPFLNTASEDDWVLAVAWLLASLRPTGPYPILVLSGEQGTAKSTASRILRSLVDPNGAAVRCLPRNDRDLAIAADNSHVLAFDNVSQLAAWTSDAFCRITTGAGFATRRMYSGRDEEVFSTMRPILLNGIPDFVTRGDLTSRSIHLQLQPIAEDQRRPESELWRDFEVARPAILGALLDAVSAGLRALPTVERPQRLPRMADFALWILACEPGLWAPGTFAEAFEGNNRAAVAATLAGDPYAILARKLADRPQGWEGTATDFIEVGIRECVMLDKGQSPAARVVGERLRRVAPLLRQEGISIEFQRQGRSGQRVVCIAKVLQTVEAQLGQALQAHDWHHDYLDDRVAHAAGERDWQRIVALCAAVDVDTARELFARWCPGDSARVCPV